jgi:hypothetical protein
MANRYIFRDKSAATRGVLQMIERDLATAESEIQFNRQSPDGDPGKFSVLGATARAIHQFNGYHLPIRQEWFNGDSPKPKINNGEFDYYALAIEPRRIDPQPHYLLVHYLTVRQWVLEFDAPLGNDWRHQKTWMGNVTLLSDGIGYFRWGDEPIGDFGRLSRALALDNVLSVTPPSSVFNGSVPPSKYGNGGESDAHKNLKQYVAEHPELLGLFQYEARIERHFTSGDRADIVFESDSSNYAAVEIELSGASNLLIGAHQAIKYAMLCAAEAGLPLEFGPEKAVKAFLVAHQTDYIEVEELARKYGITLVSIPFDDVPKS